MKPFFIIIFVFIVSFSFAQQKRRNIYFVKDNGQYVDIKDSADYIRIVSEPDSGSKLYNVDEYYMSSKRKLIGKSSTIDPPLFEGQCVSYFKTGAKQSVTNYKAGSAVGDEYDFYLTGKPYLLKEYPEVYRNYSAINYLVKESYDSLGTPQIVNGNGYYKGYDADFKYVVEQGEIKNGERDGIWKGNFRNNHMTFTENYADGNLISGTANYDVGKVVTYTNSRDVVPEFKGGLEAFGRYLAKNVRYPAEAREKNEQGKVIISFVVEKDGTLTEIKIVRGISQSIDAEALKVIQMCPPWTPGTQFGRPVRVQYSVPISFTLSGN